MSDEMDHLLTPAQKRAKTREKKQKAMLEQMGVEPRKEKKPRKKRKPMTEEQRAAAVERLAKARAARAPAKQSNVHPRVQELPDDHPLSLINTKAIIKEWKEKRSSIRGQKDSKDSKQRMEYQITENYVKNLNVWIKDGVWLDHKYGDKRQHTMSYICLAPSFKADGTVDRVHGTYYSDIGEVWTKDLEKEYEG